jgi:hypothetical protein
MHRDRIDQQMRHRTGERRANPELLVEHRLVPQPEPGITRSISTASGPRLPTCPGPGLVPATPHLQVRLGAQDNAQSIDSTQE